MSLIKYTVQFSHNAEAPWRFQVQDKHLPETQVEDSLSEFLHIIAGLDEGHGDPIHACPAGKFNVLFVLDKEHQRTSKNIRIVKKR